MCTYHLKLILSIGLFFMFLDLNGQIVETVDSIPTFHPVMQNRDSSIYNWQDRHHAILKLNKESPPKVVFIGNSILHYWAGEPLAPIQRGEDSWNRYFKEKNVRNMGFGWDRIENMLWRVRNGELDNFSASHILVLAGTNNLSIHTDTEILKGIAFLIQEIKRRQPKAKIILMGILPRRGYEARITSVNIGINTIATQLNITYANTGYMFLDTDDKINESLFSDGVHPNASGYHLLAPFIDSYLK